MGASALSHLALAQMGRLKQLELLVAKLQRPLRTEVGKDN
jgi:hypothetical protein